MNCASMVISTTRAISVVGNERYTKDLFEEIFDNGKLVIKQLEQYYKQSKMELQNLNIFIYLVTLE